MLETPIRRVVKLDIDASGAVRGGQIAAQSLDSVERRAERAIKATHGMSGAVAAISRVLATFGVALSIGALVSFTNRVTDAVGGLGELAEQVGVNVEALQAYQYAAAQAGVKQEQLEVALSKFNQKMGEAAEGGKDAIAAFQRLGVKLLDVKGNLRAPEEVLAEVAAALLRIEDPSRRGALAVDIFSKSGMRLLPLLKDLAKGEAALTAEARSVGAVIGRDVVDALDRTADRAAVARLQFAKVQAELVALTAPLRTDFIEALTGAITELNSAMRVAASMKPPEWWLKALGVGAGALVGGLWGGPLGAVGGAAGAIGIMGALGEFDADKRIKDLQKQRDVLLQGIDEPRVTESQRAARRALISDLDDQIAKLQVPKEPSVAPPVTAVADLPRGHSDPLVKGAGDKLNDRIEAARADAVRERRHAEALAAAAYEGADALAKIEAQYKAAKQAADAYGDSAAANADGVKQLTDFLYQQAVATEKATRAFKFGQATVELERDNEVLEAQLRLIGERPEIVAREIALIRVRNSEDVRSGAIGQDDIERRIRAVEAQELLNRRIEEARESMELWKEPLKTFVTGIQTTITDTLVAVFNRTISSFRDVTEALKGLWKRMLAEFGSLIIVRAVIAPVASPLLAAAGVPGAASLLGPSLNLFGSGARGGGAAGAPAGAAGAGAAAASGGWLSGIGAWAGNAWASATGWLSRPIGGFSELPQGMYGPPAPATGLGGVTWGQGLGALASAGFGAYNLARGNYFSGAAGMLGAGASLIPGLGPMAGMAINVAGMVAQSIFGKKKVTAPQSTTDILFDDLGVAYVGDGTSRGKGTNGSTAKAANSITDAINTLLRNNGLAFAAGMRGGSILNSVGKNTGDQWIAFDAPYADAVGSTIGEGLGGEEAIGKLVAQFFKRAAAEGKLVGTGATDTVKAIFKNAFDGIADAALESVEDVQEALTFARQYDDWLRGVDLTSAEKAFRDLGDALNAARGQAIGYGLDVAPVESAFRRERNKTVDDFVAGIDDALLGLSDPGALALKQLERERETALKEAAYFNEQYAAGLTDRLVDINRIEELYGAKRADIVARQAQGINDLLKRLTYGDLSGASPSATLAGTRASYEANVAQALAGDALARSRHETLTIEYLGSQRAYTGNDSNTASLLARLRADTAALAGSADGSRAANDETVALLNQTQRQVQDMAAQMAALMAVVTEQSEVIAELTAELRREKAA